MDMDEIARRLEINIDDQEAREALEAMSRTLPAAFEPLREAIAAAFNEIAQWIDSLLSSPLGVILATVAVDQQFDEAVRGDAGQHPRSGP